MFIDSYCTEHSQGSFSFTREQASRFAKQVANDFNPIHDEDSKRFCVPGDLFSLLLCQRGISTQLKVYFHNMVNDGVELTLTEPGEQGLALIDKQGREYLHLQEQGERIVDPVVIEQLIRRYVAFSGENFHLLVPLMHQKGMMINPDRPLVIYESMSLNLDTTELLEPSLESASSDLNVEGHAGTVTLRISI